MGTQHVQTAKESDEYEVDGRALFASVAGNRKGANRSVLHRLNCKIHEWLTGRFNISVCDLLIDSATRLKADDLDQARQLFDCADTIVQIWRKDQLPCGGYGTQKPTEKIRSFRGVITLSQVVRQMNAVRKKFAQIADLEDVNKKEEIFQGLHEAITLIAPGKARQKEKQKLSGAK